MKEIKIPHLQYTVKVFDLSVLNMQNEMGVPVNIKGSGYTCVSGEYECSIFIEDLENSKNMIERIPTIAHECMHAIQIMCEKFGMKVEYEQEHTAYLMHYLLKQITETDPNPTHQ